MLLLIVLMLMLELKLMLMLMLMLMVRPDRGPHQTPPTQLLLMLTAMLGHMSMYITLQVTAALGAWPFPPSPSHPTT
jgi:hypothetical protein